MNDRIDDLVAAHREDTHPAPPHLKQQWHDTIDSAAAVERGKTRSAASPWHPASVFLGMAIAATLALGIGIGYFVADEGSNGHVQDVQVADTHLKIGFITPISQHFCDTCNRVRLSVSGTLYMCLGDEHKYDLRPLLRQGISDNDLDQVIRDAINLKPFKHEFNEKPEKVVRFMSMTGG